MFPGGSLGPHPRHCLPNNFSRAQGRLGFRVYLEGQGDLVNGFIMGTTRVTIWVVGVMNLLTKSR